MYSVNPCRVRVVKIKQMYEQPGHLIRRAHQVSVAAFQEATRSLDVTSVQYCALIVIREHSGIDATGVSELIAFDRATIGNVLARLEIKGLIARRSGLEDKRTKHLFLTPGGHSVIRKIDATAARVAENVLAPLVPAERTLLMTLLAKLSSNRSSSKEGAALKTAQSHSVRTRAAR